MSGYPGITNIQIKGFKQEVMKLNLQSAKHRYSGARNPEESKAKNFVQRIILSTLSF